MSNIQELIKARRKELGLTLLDIAKACEVSEGTVSRWESGDIDDMKRSRIAALAKILQIRPSAIIGDIDEATPISMDKVVFDDYFPLHYCSNLSAGSFDELIEAEPDSVVYVPIKFQGRKKRLLAFKVNGTSMNNVIEDGSIVVVDNTATDGVGVKFKDGTIVVAYYNGLVTVKRLYDQEDKIVLMPDSTDKGHLPITIQKDGNQVTIIGKVIWHMNPDDVERYY